MLTGKFGQVEVYQMKASEFAVVYKGQTIFTRNNQLWANCDAKDLDRGLTLGEYVIDFGQVWGK